MLGDDELEAGDVHFSELQQQLEQPAHRIEVLTSFGFLHRAIGVRIDLVGREVDLSRLVDEQGSANLDA